MRGGVLGLASFYRDFIKDLCGIAKPLNDLLAVHAAGVPEEEIGSSKCTHTHTHTDASTVAIAAVLLQREPEGKPTHH